MPATPTADDGVDADRPHDVEVLVVDADTQYLLDLMDRVDRDTDELTIHTSREVDETIERLEDGAVDCLVCTYDAGKMAGLELLDYVREHHVEVPVVLLPARETTIIDSRNLVADVDAVFDRDEAVERDVLGPHLVNVVEQRRASATAERRSQVTEAMAKVARDVAGEDDPDAVDQSVADRLDDVPAFDAGWVAAVDGDAGRIEPTALTDDPANLPGFEGDAPTPALESAARRAVEFDSSQLVDADTHSYAVVPVVPERGGERVLAVCSDSQHAFREPEFDLLAELGGTVSRTLDTIATREALESRVDDLELVDDLVEDLGVGVVVYDREGRVERANAAFAELLDVDAGSLPGTEIWELLEPRTLASFDDHWESTDLEEPTVETASVGGDEFELVTTRVVAGGDDYNVTMVVDADDATMDPEFAATLAYEFRHWFDLAREAVVEAREEGDPERLELVDQLVDRMHEAVETEVEAATGDGVPTAADLQPLGEVAGLAWNHVLGEAGDYEVKGGHGVVAHRGLLLRLFEHLFRTLLRYAEGATAVDVGLTADGFYVEDDGAGVPHAQRAYVREGPTASDATHGAGILVAERAANRMGWTLSVTENDAGGTRFSVEGVEFARTEG